MKIAFISNICPHYRVKTYETLARDLDIDFYFYSAGEEWYWQQQHGVKQGKFNAQYLRGFYLGGTRISFDLLLKLFNKKYDVIIKCINGRFVLLFTFLAARFLRKPFILWTGIWMRLQTPAHRLFYPITRFLYTHSDAVVVYGEHVKGFLVEEGVKPEKIFVSTHAVDNDFYQVDVSAAEKKAVREKLSLQSNQKVILYLGRLEEIKGINYLLEAFALIEQTDTILVIAGEGSIRKSLEELAHTLNVQDRVRFTGYTSQTDSRSFYSISDIFVLPSIKTAKGKETWGLVVNEAMLQGLPVIATDMVGAAAGGLVRDGWNGFIVPEKNPECLAERLGQLLKDESLRQSYGQNSREIMKKWNNETMVAAFKQAIQFVLK